MARCDDARWSPQILEFRSDFYFERSAGRPKTRWTDQLEVFAEDDWLALAADVDQWEMTEDAFVHVA